MYSTVLYMLGVSDKYWFIQYKTARRTVLIVLILLTVYHWSSFNYSFNVPLCTFFKSIYIQYTEKAYTYVLYDTKTLVEYSDRGVEPQHVEAGPVNRLVFRALPRVVCFSIHPSRRSLYSFAFPVGPTFDNDSWSHKRRVKAITKPSPVGRGRPLNKPEQVDHTFPQKKKLQTKRFLINYEWHNKRTARGENNIRKEQVMFERNDSSLLARNCDSHSKPSLYPIHWKTE